MFHHMRTRCTEASSSRKAQASPALAVGIPRRRAQQQQWLQHQGRPCHRAEQPAVRLLLQALRRGQEGKAEQQRQ